MKHCKKCGRFMKKVIVKFYETSSRFRIDSEYVLYLCKVHDRLIGSYTKVEHDFYVNATSR